MPSRLLSAPSYDQDPPHASMYEAGPGIEQQAEQQGSRRQSKRMPRKRALSEDEGEPEFEPPEDHGWNAPHRNMSQRLASRSGDSSVEPGSTCCSAIAAPCSAAHAPGLYNNNGLYLTSSANRVADWMSLVCCLLSFFFTTLRQGLNWILGFSSCENKLPVTHCTMHKHKTDACNTRLTAGPESRCFARSCSKAYFFCLYSLTKRQKVCQVIA